MKFNRYYFENYPADTAFDINNPRYILSLDGVDEIFEAIINNGAYSLAIDDFDNKSLVQSLLQIDVLQQKQGKLAMAVPFFTEQDADILKELSKKAANQIVDRLIVHQDTIRQFVKQISNDFSAERNLYHLMAAYIFDGLMFDYLEESQLVTTSKVHQSGLDYLVVLYEDTECLDEYSNALLCSYNRLTMNGKGFVSFGDSKGNRHDFYRYMRRKELDQLSEQEHMDCSAEELIENFDKLSAGLAVDAYYVDIFEHFGYCRNGKIIVPVYDSYSYEIAKQLYEFILEQVKESLSDALLLIQEEKRLQVVAHDVPVKDVANEIYHLIFGEVNECLIRHGLIANPPHLCGEGRYFKSFEH